MSITTKTIQYRDTTVTKYGNRRISIMAIASDSQTKETIYLIVMAVVIPKDILLEEIDYYENSPDTIIETNKAGTKGVKYTRLYLSSTGIEVLHYIYTLEQRRNH